MRPHLAIALLAVALASCSSDSEQTPSTPPDSIQQAVESSVRDLNAMRESLAKTLNPDSVDQETFARVCKPVGKRAQSIAQSNDWVVQQLARKYRNPAHRPDPEADSIHGQFADNPEQTDAWIRTVREDRSGWRYFRRITVEPSCLACHGPKDKRPNFVTKKYPKDRAYGFDEGDLRGLYAVFVPDTTLDRATP